MAASFSSRYPVVHWVEAEPINNPDTDPARLESIYQANPAKLGLLYSTGLPTKDKTSETAVRTLFCLFPYIHNSLQL